MSQETFKYWAFISYSHIDSKWGGWLHRRLETYRVPRRLVGRASRNGPIPRRMFPIFRDREELPSSSNLGENIKEALQQASYLVVICSPNSARSRWVNEEIRTFKALRGEDRVLCLIVAGEPNADDKPELGLAECFPKGIKFKIGPTNEFTSERVEPIAADARKGKDGKSDAKLKLIAGLLGVDFSALRQREKERRLRFWLVVALLSIVTITAVGGAWRWQRNITEANVYIEEGRQELLKGNSFRALPYLSEAYKTRPGDPGLRFLLGQALLGLNTVEGSCGGSDDPAFFLAYAPTSDRMILAAANNTAKIVTVPSGDLIHALPNHESWVTAGVFSNDGMMIVTVSGKIVKVWDAGSGTLKWELRGHQLKVSQAKFSPDGSKIVTASVDNTARVWDSTNGINVLTLTGHSSSVISATFNGGGDRVLTTSADNTAKLWDATNGKLVISLDGHKASVTSGAFSPDGSQIVTFSSDNSCKVWDGNSGELLQSVDGVQGLTKPSLVFCPGGEILVLAPSPDGDAKLWDVSTGEALGSFKGHSAPVLAATLSTDGNYAVTSSRDNTVKRWDARTFKLLASHETTDTFYAANVHFSPDDKHFVATDDKGRTTMFRASTPNLLASLPRTKPPPALGTIKMSTSDPATIGGSVAFTPDGKKIIVREEQAVDIWSGDGATLLQSFGPPTDGMKYLATSPDGMLAVIVNRRAMRVIDLVSKRQVVSVDKERDPVTNAVFCPRQPLLVTVSGIENGGEKTVTIWHLEKGVALRSWKMPHSRYLAIYLHIDESGNSLLTGAQTDQEIDKQVWELTTGSLKQSFNKDTGIFLALSSNGRSLMTLCGSSTSSRRNAVAIWDVGSGKRVSQVETPSIFSARFDPAGKRVLVAGGEDRAVKVFDAITATLQLSFEAGATSVLAAEMSRDETRIAASSFDDRDVRIYDAVQGKLLGTLVGADNMIQHSFSPDGTRFLTAPYISPVKLWDVHLENRKPSEIAKLVEKRVPWRLSNGRLVSVPR